MIKSFIPTYHAKSIYDVDPSFFKKIGINNILIDLDNTLASYRDRHPKKEAVTLIETLKKHNYKILIISNNKGHRVATYCNGLEVDYLYSAGKPKSGKLRRLMKKHNFSLQQTMFVGDQLLTDTYVANKLNIRILLTDKIVKEDQWTTRFNRLIDRPLRRYLKRKGLLKPWEQAHERN